MKTLIIYASTYGYTAQCAESLKEKLGADTTAVNIAKEKKIDLSGYDTVVIGGSIYMGQMHKPIKEFCEKNLSALLDKKIALFISCGFSDRYQEFLASSFPPELVAKAQAQACFGGEINMEKLSFIHRTIAKMVAGASAKQSGGPAMPEAKPLPQNIEALAAALNIG